TVARDGQVARLSVSADIQHTYIGDLLVSLTAPAGSTATLHTVSDDSSANLTNTYTSDDTQALAALADQKIQGDWTLTVADRQAEDTGVLRRWSLDIDVAAAEAALAEHPPTSTAGLEEHPDDLKLITGVGPSIERRLHSAGILTYAQLATLSPSEIIER